MYEITIQDAPYLKVISFAVLKTYSKIPVGLYMCIVFPKIIKDKNGLLDSLIGLFCFSVFV